MRIATKRAGALLCAASLFLGLSIGASAGEAPNVNTVLATVDGTNITLGNVIALRARLPEQYKKLPDDVLFKGIIDQLVQQTVLANAIKTKMPNRVAIGLENEQRAFLASEMLDQISGRQVPEEDLQAAYAAKYDGAIPDQEYNASHILVKTEAEAKEIVKLLNDGADFAQLAREKSTGPSGPNGGSLGWFSQGQMVKPFEDAVLKLAVGEISAPVKTQFGWHVVKLNEMRNKAIPTLEDVRAQLTKDLQQKAVDAEIARLAAAADVVRPKVDVDPAAIRDVSLLDK